MAAPIGVTLTIPQASGVNATFHVISYVGVQPHLSLQVTVASFVDQNAFLAGDKPLCSTIVPLDITAVDQTQPLLAQLYAQLMANGQMLFGGIAS